MQGMFYCSYTILHVCRQVECGCILSECGRILSECGRILSECGHILSECGRILSECGSILSECDCILSECGCILSECGCILSEYYPKSPLLSFQYISDDITKWSSFHQTSAEYGWRIIPTIYVCMVVWKQFVISAKNIERISDQAAFVILMFRHYLIKTYSDYVIL